MHRLLTAGVLVLAIGLVVGLGISANARSISRISARCFDDLRLWYLRACRSSYLVLAA
ncbi:MAG: hypothetical protein ABSA97_04745 [Verrucomicrobiia bacterium]